MSCKPKESRSPTRDIARREGVPLGTVLSRIFTGKQLLRKERESSIARKAATRNWGIPARYVQQNFAPSDRLAVVLLNKRTQSVIQRLASAEIISTREFQDWLTDRNAQRYEVYLSMNALAPTATGRTKSDVVVIRHVYLDFDTDGTAAVEALLKRGDLPRPNYLINTSPDKWQVVWKVENFNTLQAETLQRGLARGCCADPAATDCARVLRLPGFENHKYSRPFLVRAEALATGTYRPEHFPTEERAGPLQIGDRLSTQPRARTPGVVSQSERDWAYAKPLCRGANHQS